MYYLSYYLYFINSILQYIAYIYIRYVRISGISISYINSSHEIELVVEVGLYIHAIME